MDKQEEEGFYSPEGFPSLHVTRQEICMGYARYSVRINQIKSNLSLSLSLSPKSGVGVADGRLCPPPRSASCSAFVLSVCILLLGVLFWVMYGEEGEDGVRGKWLLAEFLFCRGSVFFLWLLYPGHPLFGSDYLRR